MTKAIKCMWCGVKLNRGNISVLTDYYHTGWTCSKCGLHYVVKSRWGEFEVSISKPLASDTIKKEMVK